MRTLLALAFVTVSAAANATLVFHDLSSGDLTQDWSDAGLITANDNWDGVPSIMGYRGDNLTAVTATDPQTILDGDAAGVLDVNANQTNPNTFTTGGVTEFALTNPTIALSGSGTADAPYLLISVNATGRTNVSISYTLRDLESGSDNAIQQVALQYRLGNSGSFTNVASAYVADATSGPSALGADIPVSASLNAWSNQSMIQFRIMTTNAAGNDEWVGIDDIDVSSQPVPEPGTMAALALGATAMLRRRRSK